MENTNYVLNKVKEINNAYNLPVDRIDKLLDEISNARVCTPIIGKFSSGKSRLVNTLLGYSWNLLKVDITPETAVPTEIIYSEELESVRLYRKDNKHQDIGIEEYRAMELDASSITRSRISLRNSFLEEIPDIMIVDMPGFESGFEIHNRAIDDYLPQSLAYLVTFPADDMILRSSIGNVLKELVLNEMPICIAITKYDKRDDEFESSLENLKDNLKRFIGEKDVKFCFTSSVDGDVEEVIEFFVEIQAESQSILARKYRGDVLSELGKIEGYLKTALRSSELDESGLDDEEERLGKQLASLNYRCAGEKDEFDKQIPEIIREIKSDVNVALDAEESTFIAMALNNQKINEHVNTVVRNAVTTSINKRLIPKIEKYLKNIENFINADDVSDVHVNFEFNAQETKTGIAAPIVASAACVLTGFLLAPVIGGIVYLVNKNKAEKKREEQKKEIKEKLQNEVFPNILDEIENSLEMTITKQTKLINTTIEEEINQQREVLEKAVDDIRKQMADEKDKKENFAKDVNNDLTRIEELRNMIS